MKRNRALLFAIAAIITALAPLAAAQYDLVCHFDPIKAGRVSVYTLPDGSGDSLSNAWHWDGVPGHPPVRIDATITYTLFAYGDPVFGYPREDMWLVTSLGGLVLCPAGSIADANTNQMGQTTFSQAVRGGGATDPNGGEVCLVMVSGMVCPLEGLDIQFNSPDINGDLTVNLTDVVLFAGDYGGAYDYAADFYWDGVVNLSDAVYLAWGLQVSCP
jgi:hypothetical protein